VVDDELHLTKVLEHCLSSQGYQVLCANSGQQALSILKNKTADLVISDIVMPNMDGYQLATQIQKLYPQIKIQLVSGFSETLHNNQTVQTELQKNILIKPYSSQTLLASVRKLLDEASVTEPHTEDGLAMLNDD